MVYTKLEKFLSQYPKKEKHTHTIYGGDIKTGAYTIPVEKTDEFHKLIAKANPTEPPPAATVPDPNNPETSL